MRTAESLSKLMEKDIATIKNRPAISVFRDNLSLGTVLTTAYIVPKYNLRKQGRTSKGITEIYEAYKDKNIIFIGDGGTGKTSAFLRLYIGADGDIMKIADKQFIYFFAPDLLVDIEALDDYPRELRKLIESGDDLNGILLLDGLEEAYLNDSKGASEQIEKLKKSNITFWVSCRTSFYDRLDDRIIQYFAEIITIDPWDETDFNTFVDNCLESNEHKKSEIRKRIDTVRTSVKSLKLRPLFATMILFLAEDLEINDINNEYELIELFINKWIEREIKEKGIVFDKDESYKTIRSVALSVYLNTNKRPEYNNSIQVFRDLLVMSNLRTKEHIHGFYHREFLIYFIANALIDSALYHPDEIIWWFSQTFYDDITNMIKPVLSNLDLQDTTNIYDNLFNVYRRTYENTSDVEAKFKALGLSPEESFLRLRDEVIYFILKLPNIDYEKFVQYAYKNSTDTILFLAIAHGMASIDPNNKYTFEFAKKLIPGNPEDIRNRGWGICFFGDVDDNGYKYDDTEKKPWKKIRDNRLKRLSDNKTKHMTRVLDIPLLYCYYASREFSDCTSFTDYKIIKETNITLDCFGAEQKAFMRDKKNLLVSKYREQLFLKELKEHISFARNIRKENITMNNDTNHIMLEIDEELAEKIMCQIGHREDVHNNIKQFWINNGTRIIEEYSEQLKLPGHKNISFKDFKKNIASCKVLIISANYVEGVIVTRHLMNERNGEKLDAYSIDGHLYQFATIESIPVLHIWPTNKSSFTQYGSFSALNSALDRFSPKYVIAVGVAFGIDPLHHSIGDVLIAKSLVFYDNFNKVTNGKLELIPQETYQIDVSLIAQLHQLENIDPPESVGTFKWYFGTMLTGGSVLSDTEEKMKLIEAANKIGYEVVGGEMEASGIYYACKMVKKRNIPFMIIKGICDWGEEKNSWNEVIGESYDNDKIKNCVQAFSCDNAYKAMRNILSQLNME